MFFNVSSIIRNDFDKQIKLVNWIEQKLNKNIILELIFKMTENGFTAKDFHHYCDNKGPTLILIKTSNDEIIGGFTTLNWETTTERENKYDELGLTFLFSLTLNKKFNMIKQYIYPAIQNAANIGPSFGIIYFQIQILEKGFHMHIVAVISFMKEKQNQLKKKVKLYTLMEINMEKELLQILKFWNLKYIKLFIKNNI